MKKIIVLLLFLLPFASSLTFDFSLPNGQLLLGQKNTVDGNYSCFILLPDSKYHDGDLIDYKIYAYASGKLILAKEGIIIHSPTCKDSFYIDIFVPKTDPNYASSITMAVQTKLRYENRWEFIKFQRLSYNPPLSSQVQTFALERNILNFVTLVGIVLLLLSIFFMLLRIWWAMLLLIVSIVVVVAGIFFF